MLDMDAQIHYVYIHITTPWSILSIYMVISIIKFLLFDYFSHLLK